VEPRVRIEILDSRPEGDRAGRWRVSWLIRNDDAEPIQLHSAWIPHGRFRGDGRLPLAMDVASGGSARLELSVTAAEPPSSVVHNAFLILQVSDSGRAWRVFARMRVEFDAQARPRPIVEVVTSQSIQ
jgi:hypothetical protein